MKREYVLDESEKVLCIVKEEKGLKISYYPYDVEPETRYTERMEFYASGCFTQKQIEELERKNLLIWK